MQYIYDFVHIFKEKLFPFVVLISSLVLFYSCFDRVLLLQEGVQISCKTWVEFEKTLIGLGWKDLFVVP